MGHFIAGVIPASVRERLRFQLAEAGLSQDKSDRFALTERLKGKEKKSRSMDTRVDLSWETRDLRDSFRC